MTFFVPVSMLTFLILLSKIIKRTQQNKYQDKLLSVMEEFSPYLDDEAQEVYKA